MKYKTAVYLGETENEWLTHGKIYKILSLNIYSEDDENHDEYIDEGVDQGIFVVQTDGRFKEQFAFPSENWELSKDGIAPPKFKSKLEEEIYNLKEIGYKDG